MAGHVRGRALAWVEGVDAVATAAGLVVYFVVAGLDKADKLASVVSAFISLVGLVMSAYGTVLARRP